MNNRHFIAPRFYWLCIEHLAVPTYHWYYTNKLSGFRMDKSALVLRFVCPFPNAHGGNTNRFARFSPHANCTLYKVNFMQTDVGPTQIALPSAQSLWRHAKLYGHGFACTMRPDWHKSCLPLRARIFSLHRCLASQISDGARCVLHPSYPTRAVGLFSAWPLVFKRI